MPKIGKEEGTVSSRGDADDLLVNVSSYIYTPTKVKHHHIFLSIYFSYINTVKTIK
jgi:hypothetical protein